MYFWAGGQGIRKARRMYFRSGLSPKKRGLRVRCPSRVSARLATVLVRRSVKKVCVWLGEVSRGSDGNAIC